MTSAADFMNTKIQTVPPDMTLEKVVEFLLKNRLSNAPVVEETQSGQRLLGFISERDCLSALSSESFYGFPAPPLTAQHIMRRHPMCVSPDTELFALASIFISHDYRHLPVTDKGLLKGIVSRRDILRALNEYAQQTSEPREQQSDRPDLDHLVSHRFFVSRSRPFD